MSENQEHLVFPPAIQDADADRRFRESAEQHGWDPDDPFVGGYVDWEWRRSRHAYDNLFTSVRGKKVLEFGCHLGGTSIVLAALGAEVTAIDVDPQYVELTRLNAERHELSERIRALHVPDTTRVPFADGEFDLVSCNSVLEYVPPHLLRPVQREIDRVLAPGGHIVVIGTSNRLWPREIHSRRWLVNYIPRPLHRMLLAKRVGSVFPWELRSGFGDYQDLAREDAGRLFVEMKARMGVSSTHLKALTVASRMLSPLGAHAGFISPTITMLLQKRCSS